MFCNLPTIYDMTSHDSLFDQNELFQSKSTQTLNTNISSNTSNLRGMNNREEQRMPNEKQNYFATQSFLNQDEREADEARSAPLAYRMRPTSLEDYVGQEHLLAKNAVLRRAIERDLISSIILYGPPGTGKTTLAQIIAHHTKASFAILNAVLQGVQQIRCEVEKAVQTRKSTGRRTILFVDEVHRWNRAQQDALLPYVENGTIILIGATTENPFFEVNKALLSRSRVFELKPLTKSDLEKIFYQAFHDKERGYGSYNITLEDGVMEGIITYSGGDARVLLNTIESCVELLSPSWPLNENEEMTITLESISNVLQTRQVLYDKKGDYHYDVISAFIKSVRGGDADAALYYLALMCAAGEDAHFIFRRLLILACEDVGLACPEAISVVVACKDAFDMVGFPEGNYFLSHATLYLTTREKSNSTSAFFHALGLAKEIQCEVPTHLKDSSRYSSLSHGKGYLYPHDYEGHWVAQQYLPDALIGRVFYQPSDQGAELEVKEKYKKQARQQEKLQQEKS